MGAQLFDDAELELMNGTAGAPSKPLPPVQAPPPNNDLSPLNDANGEPAAGSPPAAAKPQAPAPNSPYSPDEQSLMSATAAQPQATKALNAGEPSGAVPDDAIAESPIGVLDRAILGWTRTPAEQQKYLKGMFSDVELTDTAEGGKSFVVKDQDGKWYQIDPNFHWTKSAAGLNVPEWDSHNAKYIAGAFMNSVGEYGLRAEAAAAGGAQGALTGAAFGPIGAIGGALVGAGAAAAAAEGLDLAARKGAQMAVGDYPGAVPYKNPEEVKQQLYASAILGAETWAGGKILQKGVQSTAKLFGSALETMVGTEGGKQTARKILGAMGANEGLTEARLMNPKATAVFDDMAAADLKKGVLQTGALDKAETGAFDALSEDMQSALKREQGEFAKMQAQPNVQAMKLNNAQVTQDPLNSLKESGVLSSEGKLIKAGHGGVYGEGDTKPIQYIRALAARDMTQMTYQEVRQEVNKIGTLLNGSIQNNQIKQTLVQLKNGLNDSIIKGLGDKGGAEYKGLLNKYSTVRQTMEELGAATTGAKKYTFIGKLVNQEKRTVSRDLISGLQEAGVPFDNIKTLMQIQSARDAAPLFASKGRFSKYLPVLPNPSRIAAGVSNAYGAIGELGAGAKQIAGGLPYSAKTLKFMKSLPADQLKQLMTNPQLFDQLAGTATAGFAGQLQETDQLLKTAGVK